MKITHPILRTPTSLADAHALAAALLEASRARFGEARMELEDDGDDPDDDGADGGDDSGSGTPTPADVARQQQDRKHNEHGYPDNTPVKEMTEAERVAYSRHRRQVNAERRQQWDRATGGRSPEQIRADLEELETRRRAEMTPAEQAVADARREGEQAGRAAERAAWATRAVAAEIRGALRARRVEDDRITQGMAHLDLKSFLTVSGEVDADKVTSYASGFGSQTPPPDMGQGRRGENDSRPSVSRSREAYLEERRGKGRR